MPVKAVKAVASTVNGVNSFVLPCKKIRLAYSNWGGSSSGIKQFIKSKNFKKFAEENPSIHIELLEKNGHPVVTGFYNNGNTKPICVKNMSLQEVNKKLNIIRESSGARLGQYKHAVKSLNESPRGIWSPFHVDPEKRYKI